MDSYSIMMSVRTNIARLADICLRGTHYSLHPKIFVLSLRLKKYETRTVLTFTNYSNRDCIGLVAPVLPEHASL